MLCWSSYLTFCEMHRPTIWIFLKCIVCFFISINPIFQDQISLKVLLLSNIDRFQYKYCSFLLSSAWENEKTSSLETVTAITITRSPCLKPSVNLAGQTYCKLHYWSWPFFVPNITVLNLLYKGEMIWSMRMKVIYYIL